MKYYCENCGSAFEFGLKVDPLVIGERRCPICDNEYPHDVWIKPFPDYETPSEYKARTGKELSDKAQVWLRMFVGDKPDDVWHTCSLELALQYKSALDGKNCTATPGDTRIYHVQILIGGLEPPPDDWKGELK